MSKHTMERVASRSDLAERLTKRARLALREPISLSSINSPGILGSDYRWYTTDECRELLDLLLLKAGFDIAKDGRDPNQPLEVRVIETLKKEYSPRAAELLVKMVTGGGELSDVVSEVSSIADVEEAPQTVPVLAPSDSIEASTARTDVAPEFAVPTLKKDGVEYKKDTEISLSRIFDLGKAATVVDPSIPPTAPYNGPKVVTMSGFGKLGRFGNQVLQYIFLKCYAEIVGAKEVQIPGWIGSLLFGLDDEPVQRALPAVIEFRETKANSTFTTEFIDYIEASNGGRAVQELHPNILGDTNLGNEPVNVDIWGWFQWHTSVYAPFKAMIQNIFEPVPSLKTHMDSLFEEKIKNFGSRRCTVVGIHIRRGDYKNIAASSFGYCAPTTWYLEWLERVWHTLDDPVLLITSDEVDAVAGDFAAYKPITAASVGFDIPTEFKGRKAGFFPDWYALTKCDVLGISNSTFSFTACMMNKVVGSRFYRPHYLDHMTEFNPWSADPIIHRDLKKNSIHQALETLQVVYATEGSKGVLRNMLYELPFHAVRSLIIKGVLWREARLRQKHQLVPVA